MQVEAERLALGQYESAYPLGDIVERWLNSSKPGTYNPQETLFDLILPSIKEGLFKAANVYTHYIGMHFIGERLGWNPVITLVATTALLAGEPIIKRLAFNYFSRSS